MPLITGPAAAPKGAFREWYVAYHNLAVSCYHMSAARVTRPRSNLKILAIFRRGHHVALSTRLPLTTRFMARLFETAPACLSSDLTVWAAQGLPPADKLRHRVVICPRGSAQPGISEKPLFRVTWRTEALATIIAPILPLTTLFFPLTSVSTLADTNERHGHGYGELHRLLSRLDGAARAQRAWP